MAVNGISFYPFSPFLRERGWRQPLSFFLFPLIAVTGLA